MLLLRNTTLASQEHIIDLEEDIRRNNTKEKKCIEEATKKGKIDFREEVGQRSESEFYIAEIEKSEDLPKEAM